MRIDQIQSSTFGTYIKCENIAAVAKSFKNMSKTEYEKYLVQNEAATLQLASTTLAHVQQYVDSSNWMYFSLIINKPFLKKENGKWIVAFEREEKPEYAYSELDKAIKDALNEENSLQEEKKRIEAQIMDQN